MFYFLSIFLFFSFFALFSLYFLSFILSRFQNGVYRFGMDWSYARQKNYYRFNLAGMSEWEWYAFVSYSLALVFYRICVMHFHVHI